MDSHNTCLAVTSLDSNLKKSEKLLSASVLKECKYPEKPVSRNINDNLSGFSSDDDSDGSDDE